MDKGYVGSIPTIRAKGAYPMVILRYNMKDKNKENNRWISRIRCPYKAIISKQNKRVR